MAKVKEHMEVKKKKEEGKGSFTSWIRTVHYSF